MNIGAILAMLFRLSVPAVLTVEKVVGDAKAGADKKTMAHDALAGATAAALSVLDGDKAVYAQAASDAASEAIDAAVELTRKDGRYQAATQTAADSAALTAAAAATAQVANG